MFIKQQEVSCSVATLITLIIISGDNLLSTTKTRLKLYENCDELHFHGQKLSNHVKDIANELPF